jgi:hypothetical protein
MLPAIGLGGNLDKLIARHGGHFGIPELLRLLSADVTLIWCSES